MARAVVTGCAGFIGSHLTDRLLRGGYTVVGIDRRGPDNPEAAGNLAAALRHPRFTLVRGDLTQLVLDPHLEGARWVFHLAGRSGGRQGWGNRFEGYLRDNVAATQQVLEALRRVGGPLLIHASTWAVYGHAPPPHREGGPVQPATPYGVTKLAAEHLVRTYHRRHCLPYVILRLYPVYGPRQRRGTALRRMMEQAARGEPVAVAGARAGPPALTYVDDVVRALLRAAWQSQAVGATINIAGTEPVSWRRVVAELERLAGRPLCVRHTGPASPGPARCRPCLCRARSLLDWSPSTPLAEGLRRQWLSLYLEKSAGGTA